MIADIIVIVIVAIFVSIGYKAGLLRSLMGMVSFILSIIVAIFIYPSVSEFLAKTPLYTYFDEKLTESLPLEIMLISPDGLTKPFLNVIAFVLVIIVSRIIIWLITKLLDIFSKLPVIKQFNRLGGAALGGIRGILILYIVFALIAVFEPFKENDIVLSSIEESSFASELYNDNILLTLIRKGRG